MLTQKEGAILQRNRGRTYCGLTYSRKLDPDEVKKCSENHVRKINIVQIWLKGCSGNREATPLAL